MAEIVGGVSIRGWIKEEQETSRFRGPKLSFYQTYTMRKSLKLHIVDGEIDVEVAIIDC